MKSLIIIMLLVAGSAWAGDTSNHLFLSGERWEPDNFAHFNYDNDGRTFYRQAHVIAVYECDNDCLRLLMTNCCKARELFTVPHGETKRMTPKEVEIENKRLEK